MKLAEGDPETLSVPKFADPSIAAMIDIVGSDCPLQFFVCEYAYGYGCMIGEFAYLLSIALPEYHAGMGVFFMPVSQRTGRNSSKSSRSAESSIKG